MELSYNQLKKRDVINVVDGQCLGKIIDMALDFPDAVLTGIVVPGRKVRGIFKLFNRSRLFIDERSIIKIGGDVILVDIKCGGTCVPSVRLRRDNQERCRPPKPCPPPQPRKTSGGQGNLSQNGGDNSRIFAGVGGRIDTEDY